LDFGNEALKGSEKAFKRLWEAYTVLQGLPLTVDREPITVAENGERLTVDDQVNTLLAEFDEFMNDDFNTAKVLASMFELVPIINGIKDKHISIAALKPETLALLKSKMKVYVEDIFGLKHEQEGGDKLEGVLQLLMTLRKDAKTKKDFVTSDRIRNELAAIGVLIKDEKDGGMSYSLQ
jgi:cysteinyl-tRNA synthetase